MSRMDVFSQGPVVDSMTYQGRYLTSWTLFTLRGVQTAISSLDTWRMMGKLLLVSFVTALLVFLTVPDPTALKSSKFKSISVFLRFFVGLLLGFFLTSAVNRWYECTSGFMALFQAVRSMHMQLFALGAEKEKIAHCLRYATLSGYLLTQMLHQENMEAMERELASKALWDMLDVSEEVIEEGCILDEMSDGETFEAKKISKPGQGFLRLSKTELKTLRNVRDPACMLWMWVSSLLGRMSQDGDVPPLASPTYCHLQRLAGEAHAGIRMIRQSMAIQLPFVYVHMVCVLVHVNNFVSALSFGLTLGCFCGTEWDHHFGHPANPYQPAGTVNSKDPVRDLENVVVSFVISIVGSFLYHVFLVTCVNISQPFSNDSTAIPTDKLILSLQQDLHDATLMARSVPSWKEPSFRSASKAAAVASKDTASKAAASSPSPSR